MANSTPPDDDVLLQWNCPHCQSLLELDDTGELIVLEAPPLEEGERAGVNGIKVIEADPDWKKRDQLFNLGEKKRKIQRGVFGFEHALGNAAEVEESIELARQADLKARNINSKTTDTNDN